MDGAGENAGTIGGGFVGAEAEAEVGKRGVNFMMLM
jgi:hypothetical protein